MSFNSGKFQDSRLDKLAGSQELRGVLVPRPSAKYSSGARTILRINSQIVGFAFNISWRVNTNAIETRGIDDYLPQEITPTTITVEGTMGMFHIPSEGASAKGFQAQMLNFLFQQYITIEVRDSATDELLLFVPQAMVTSRSEDIRAESLTAVSLSWRAIGWKDEVEPAMPAASTLVK